VKRISKGCINVERKKIAVIANGKSDLLDILLNNSIKSAAEYSICTLKPNEVHKHDLNSFHSIAILGGTSDKPLILSPVDRVKIEEQIEKGKKLFAEYVGSICYYYYPEPATTRFDRLVFIPNTVEIAGLEPGDLLDDQCNSFINPYPGMTSGSTPILQYVNMDVHKKADIDQMQMQIQKKHISNKFINADNTGEAKLGLWLDRRENLLICSFRLCNFIKARFAPKSKWKSLIAYIYNWITGEVLDINEIPEAYVTCKNNHEDKDFKTNLKKCIEMSMSWFEESNMLLNNGKDGIMEGMATEIYPDGSQRVLEDVRNDCTGEASLAYFMNYMLTGEQKNLEISNNLAYVCFELLQDKSHTHLKGMMRWSKIQWGICYQDDVARVLIPQFLKCLYTGDNTYLQECKDALDFLVKTTGTDGTRISRTSNATLTLEEMDKLASKPGNFPCVHHNGYYHAALLLAYKLTGVEGYKDTAVKGLTTIMRVYPDTIREHSETQELCRLILPLAWLYWVTGEDQHREWLYKVTSDLCRFQHPSGGFLEWDTGYKAHRSVMANTEECSLLARNGDPITDLLYSMNWLPIGFIQAYFITGDDYFKKLWKDVARFMMSAQIHSDNKAINGAWARAFDVELNEIYGMPKDRGWGPCVIESGWTVAEIVSGLIMGMLEDKISQYYKQLA